MPCMYMHLDIGLPVQLNMYIMGKQTFMGYVNLEIPSRPLQLKFQSFHFLLFSL